MIAALFLRMIKNVFLQENPNFQQIEETYSYIFRKYLFIIRNNKDIMSKIKFNSTLFGFLSSILQCGTLTVMSQQCAIHLDQRNQRKMSYTDVLYIIGVRE